MLIPKRIKFRKTQRGVMKGTACKGTRIAFGEYGLRAMESAWITTRQIEAVRLVLTRFLKEGSKIWVRLFADKPVTKKPAETRQGKGKGDPDHWVCVVRKGRILFELEGTTLENAKAALRLAAHKMPIRTKFVTRHD